MKPTLLVLLCALCSSLAQAAPAEPRLLGPKPKPGSIRRVVTVAPSLTATVLALGAKDTLVGVSRYDSSPEVAGLPRVGGFNDPSVEAVLALKPDLVLVETAPANRRPVERMAELGLSVLAVPLHDVAQTLAALKEVGRLLGQQARAGELVRNIEGIRTQVRAARPKGTPLRVLFVYGFEPFVVAGPGSFAHEFLGDLGAQNLAADAASAYVAYPLERAIRLKPDVVVDASDSDVGRAKVKSLPGLKESRWERLPSLELLQPGPGLGKGLLELQALLYSPAHPDGGTLSP